MKTRIWMGTLAVLILIAGFFGIGYLVYQAGVAQGSAGLDPAVTVRPMFASQPMLTALIGFLVFLFLIRFVTRLLFFPAYGHRMHHWRWGGSFAGPGRKHWFGDDDQSPPPFFKRWHDLAHGDAQTDEGKGVSGE